MTDRSKKILQRQDGMALLLAVTVMSLLVAVTLEFNRNMRQEMVDSVNIKENTRLGAVVRSGYALAEAALLQDLEDNKFDSGHDRWAKLVVTPLAPLFGSGSLELSVTDLGGRLQVNSLGGATSQPVRDGGRKQLTSLLASGDFGDLSTDTISLIVDAVTDWVDLDDNRTGFEETESSYYLSQQPAYACKNGPFEYIEELLLVRGITRELYFGTAEYKGLRDYVSVHGNDGKININSAPMEILMMLHVDMTTELAQKMVDFRAEESNKDLLDNSDWYTRIPSWPGYVTFEADSVTVQSSFFAIIAKAEFGDMAKRMDAVVHRLPDGTIKAVTRKVE